MANKESIHKKLRRVRPPRVQIEYAVEVGDAIELKQIPFVLGVLGDFSGMPKEKLPPLKDRKFVDLNPDNFDDVLSSVKPRLAFTVENKLSGDPDAGNLKVELQFRQLEDFEPERVVNQVTPLRKLLELRTNLGDLRANLQTNEALDDLLQEVMNNSEKMDSLRKELASDQKTGEKSSEEEKSDE